MCPQRRTTWTREQIHTARRAVLAPLLQAKGFHLVEAGTDNYRIREHPDIIVKHGFWRSSDNDRGGNAIDFFVFVLGMSFNHAMQAILGGQNAKTVRLRHERGNPDRNLDGSSARRSNPIQA
jgi:hypothetical protein